MDNIIIEPEISTGTLCIQCHEPIAEGSKFCTHCGAAQINDDYSSDLKWINVKQIAIFFLFDAVICAICNYVDFFKTLNWSVTFAVLMAIIAITFFCDKWRENKFLLSWNNFSLLKLLYYCGIAIVGSLVVNFVVDWLDETLLSEQFSYYPFYATHKYGTELMIFFIAVMPALFEELGYRGFVLQKLLSIGDKKQAIFISAFLFAIMHMAFISLFWLIPFALLLGYVRVKENTLWYGVCMHFCFNFTACMIDLHKFA